MDKPRELIEIEESLRQAAESVRRGDPDTLAGRMPKEWREQEAARLAAEKGKDCAQSKKKA
jgi:hypothetical protein